MVDIRRIQAAIDHNGKVLEGLIVVLGVRDQLAKHLDDEKKVEDDKRYTASLAQCRDMVERGKAATRRIGPGATVFAKSDKGAPLAVNFESLAEDLRPLFLDKDVGDTVTLPNEGGVLTIEAVFDLRQTPKGDGKHPASKRGKGKRR
jgi:hypothetical protein